MIALVLVLAYWGFVHADDADVCRPRLGASPPLLCLQQSGAASPWYPGAESSGVLRLHVPAPALVRRELVPVWGD